MMQTMTRGHECSAATGDLLVAFELSQRWGKVGFTTGMGQRVRTRRIAAGALEALAQAIGDGKKMLGLAAEARVISCYEAGRDGFWLHRYLTGRGDTNYVVDSASIEVDRRARRTKTDAVDLRGLLALLARYVAGRSALLAGGAGPKCGGRRRAPAAPDVGNAAGRSDASHQSAESGAGQPRRAAGDHGRLSRSR